MFSGRLFHFALSFLVLFLGGFLQEVVSVHFEAPNLWRNFESNRLSPFGGICDVSSFPRGYLGTKIPEKVFLVYSFSPKSPPKVFFLFFLYVF